MQGCRCNPSTEQLITADGYTDLSFMSVIYGTSMICQASNNTPLYDPQVLPVLLLITVMHTKTKTRPHH